MTNSGIEPPPAKTRIPAWLPAALVLLYVAYFFGSLRFTAPGLAERDGYWHVRFSQMLPSLGVSAQFPYVEHSIWTAQFCDKDFLYHVAMVPFCMDAAEPLNGARYFSVLSTLLIFVALYFVLRKNRVPFAPLFVALPLCMGGDFLNRLEMIRSHIFSMSLALIGMHLLMGKRWKWLFALGFLYSWTYSFPFVLCMFAVPFVFGRWLEEGELDWKSPLASLLGVLVGLLIHPYSPHTWQSIMVILMVAAFGSDAQGSLQMGDETYSYAARDMLMRLPFYNALFFSTLLLGLRVRKKMSPEFMGAFCTAVFWYLMTMFYMRFIEYSIPLFVLALGLGVRDLLAGVDVKEQILARHPRLAMAGAVLALAVLSAAHIHSSDALYKGGALTADPPRFRGALKWIEEHSKPGDVVLNLWWNDFCEMFYDSQRPRYVWGLDPSYTWRFNREQAVLLEKTRKGEIPLDGRKLAETFKCRFLILKNHSPGLNLPEFRSGKWRPVYFDKTAIVFDLREAPPVQVP